MIIKDVITLAKFGELAGVATKDNTEAIVAFMNLGMIEIYGRFPIKVNEHLLVVEPGVVRYEMPSDFMYPTNAYEATEETCEEMFIELGINDEEDEYGLFFNDWNTVQISENLPTDKISIIYVAKPQRITESQALDGTTELDLPETLIDCLLSFIGYRGHLGVKSDSKSENNAHWVRFEKNCSKARENGVAFPADSIAMSDRIIDRGFA